MKMKRWAALAVSLVLLCTGTAMGEDKEMFKAEWYQQAVQDAVMSTGNNARLKQVIERAKNGEEITIATIGGSNMRPRAAPMWTPKAGALMWALPGSCTTSRASSSLVPW